MAILPTLVLALVLLALLCLPVFLAVAIDVDEPDDALRRARRRLRAAVTRAHDRFAVWRTVARQVCRRGCWTRRDRRRAARAGDGSGPAGPPIERIAADLRRLGSQRLAAAARSRLWRVAVLQAYDERLRLASRRLGVTEFLSGLDGVDLEIERLRVEGELQAAGLVLISNSARGRRREQR